MLGLDKLVGVDAYSRNKKLLNELGVQYTPHEHKLYLAWLVIKNKEEISLKQCALNLGMDKPLSVKDSESYAVFPDKDRTIYAKAPMHRDNRYKVDTKNRETRPVLEEYMEALAEAVTEKLSIESKLECNEALKSETSRYKLIGENWTQSWTLKNERNNKTALIL